MAFPEPVLFVSLDDENVFRVHDEAIALLRGIKGKVSIVSVTGLYRTGKSFLLNLLMDNHNTERAFQVGSTVNACTKGIWICGDPIVMEDGTNVVFVDTEGLGSSERGQDQDAKIFSLGLLLSSHFVYNSRGVIDGNALEDLSLVVNLARFIHTKSGGAGKGNDGSDLHHFFPSFLWVVRDFTLDLKDGNGRAIKPREYLEGCLEQVNSVSEDGAAKNHIRMLIRSFFSHRDCATLVRPVHDEAALQRLAETPYDELRPEFRTPFERMKKRLFASIQPKMMYGRVLDGGMLSQLAQAYVAAYNGGGAPVISTAWSRVVEQRCQEANDEAVAKYHRLMDLVLLDGGGGRGAAGEDDATDFDEEDSCPPTPRELPVASDDLSSSHEWCAARALCKFNAMALQDTDDVLPFRDALCVTLEEKRAAYERQNLDASKAFCEKLIAELESEFSGTGPAAEAAEVAEAAEAAQAMTSSPKKKAGGGQKKVRVLHTVSEGETAESICGRYGIELLELARNNRRWFPREGPPEGTLMPKAELQLWYLPASDDGGGQAGGDVDVGTAAAAAMTDSSPESFLVIDFLQCQHELQALAASFRKRSRGPASDVVLSDYLTTRGLHRMTSCAEECQSLFRRRMRDMQEQVDAGRRRPALVIATDEAEKKMRDMELSALQGALSLQQSEGQHAVEKLELKAAANDEQIDLLQRQTMNFEQIARDATMATEASGEQRCVNPFFGAKKLK